MKGVNSPFLQAGERKNLSKKNSIEDVFADERYEYECVRMIIIRRMIIS
jgi:hypothetical protein